MKKNYTLRSVLFLVAIFVGGVSTYAQYCTYSGTNKANNRYLKSFSIEGGISEFTITGEFGLGAKIYQDFTDVVLQAEPEDALTTTIDYTASGMHGYLYIDYNNDGEFSPALSEEYSGVPTTISELVAFSYYKGINSSNDISSPTSQLTGLPTFTLSPFWGEGEYRARLKIDFNNTDPCGHPDATKYYPLSDYGGIILDFTLRIVDSNAVDKVENRDVKVYATDGKIVIESENAATASIYTVNGAVVKTVSVLGNKTIELPAAMYIVNVNGEATLVVVK